MSRCQPNSRPISEDFPAPDAPTMATCSPGPIVRLMSRRIRCPAATTVPSLIAIETGADAAAAEGGGALGNSSSGADRRLHQSRQHVALYRHLLREHRQGVGDGGQLQRPVDQQQITAADRPGPHEMAEQQCARQHHADQRLRAIEACRRSEPTTRRRAPIRQAGFHAGVAPLARPDVRAPEPGRAACPDKILLAPRCDCVRADRVPLPSTVPPPGCRVPRRRERSPGARLSDRSESFRQASPAIRTAPCSR